MTCDEEALTEYLDAELAPGRRSEVEAHLAACASCRTTLERLKAGSAAFKAHAAVLPRPGAVRETRGRSPGVAAAVSAFVCFVGILLVVGLPFKPVISGIFNQMMGMISGAASTVGSGDGGGPILPPPPSVSDGAVWALILGLAVVLGLAAGVLSRRRPPKG